MKGKIGGKKLGFLLWLTSTVGVLTLTQSALFADSVFAKESLVIGSPYEENLERGSIVEGPENPKEDKSLRRFQYQISCTLRKGSQAILYDSVSPLIPSKKKLVRPNDLSLGVSYFASDQTSQFIFGSFADSYGRSDGRKYFVRSMDWECKLYDLVNEDKQN